MTQQLSHGARSAHGPHTASARCERPRHRYRKPLAVMVAVGGLSLLGTGAFASWQATGAATTAALNAATGTLSVLDASGGRLAVSVANLLPADYLYRYVDVTNTGTVPAVTTLTATSTGTLSAALKVTAEACSGTWNTTTGACTGTVTQLGNGFTTGTVALGTSTLAAGGVQHARFKVELPSATASTFMGSTATVTLSAVSDLTGTGDRTAG